MTMDAFADRLSEYLDDELSPAERAAVDAHLAACPECRSTLAALRTIVADARHLADVPPANDLWSGINAQIAARGQRTGHVSAFRRAISARLSFTLPQLAAAALALMVLSGTLVWMAKSGDPRADFDPISAETASPAASSRRSTLSDVEYQAAIADLERTLAAGRARLDPPTARVVDEELSSLDRSIDQSRRALEADPGNVDLTSQLAAARQKKVAVLRRAVELTRQ
jgi:hypothetical protein